MKPQQHRCLLVSGWMLLAPVVLAQTSEPLQVDVERQRISEQRAHHEAVFQQAEQVCYRQFAVSDCLRRARLERREALNELRRQELVLNDLERQAKAMAELKRIESRSAPAESQ
jgi:hypothetical protein